MKKRISAIILAGIMVLGMTGCEKSKADAYKKYVELGNYKGIEYTKTVAKVTDEDVKAKLDSFVNGLTEKEEVKDRPVEDGDVVNIDFVGTKDGKEFEGGSATGHELEIGSKSFIDGFETGLIGHNIGEEVSLDLTFPEEYQSPDLAGEDVTFKVTINSISVKKVPELTDALVKENTEYKTIKEYKASIKKELEETNKTNADQMAKSDIFNKAVKNSKITGYDEAEVKDLVDKEFKNFKETAESYKSYGYSYEDVLKMNGFETEKDLKKGITEYVKNFLNQKMVLYCIADKEKIKVTSEETDKMVKEYMEQYGVKTKEEVYEYFGDDYFELAVLTDKVNAMLEKNAKLVDSTEAPKEEKEDKEEKSDDKEDKADKKEEK